MARLTAKERQLEARAAAARDRREQGMRGRAEENLKTVLAGLVKQEGNASRASKRLGFDSRSKLADWMKGKSYPERDNLTRIAVETGCSLDWLLGFPVGQNREDREMVSDLRGALRKVVVERLEAQGRSLSALNRYVPLPPQLLDWVVGQVGDHVAKCVEERRTVVRQVTEKRLLEIAQSLPATVRRQIVNALLEEDGVLHAVEDDD